MLRVVPVHVDISSINQSAVTTATNSQKISPFSFKTFAGDSPLVSRWHHRRHRTISTHDYRRTLNLIHRNFRLITIRRLRFSSSTYINGDPCHARRSPHRWTAPFPQHILILKNKLEFRRKIKWIWTVWFSVFILMDKKIVWFCFHVKHLWSLILFGKEVVSHTMNASFLFINTN